MVWLLPEPDSPTIATVSPRAMVMLTPRTASTIPSGVLKRTWRSLNSSSGSPATSVVPRIEGVAEAVAEEVEREQRRDEEDRREDEQPRRRLDVGGALGDQRAEAGQRLL